MSLLAKRYAEALFVLATQQGAVDAVGADLAAVHAALGAPGARALVTSARAPGAASAACSADRSPATASTAPCWLARANSASA